MPVYDPDEHELLQEKSSMTRGGEQYFKGTLYLTDKRLIYEEKGHRGLIHAHPSKILLDLPLYLVVNISIAVPKIKLGTKKTLSVEFTTEKGDDRATFVLKDPGKWQSEMMRWTTDAKRRHEQEEKIKSEEEKRREIELARAKAPTANIGMYINAGKKEGAENQNKNFIETTFSEINPERLEKGEETKALPKTKRCPNCGKDIPIDSVYCPYCGFKQP
ncbi:TVG0758278 [Thermoplasma volcanium GSS1]|uniref:TVG0758278 protein n=1 Tax=Thermoplasma volcanium (strain ATCC 51530 / DSM 4299 / JCM 9571 / NBRC 15438 / GSS1) TaxID=273116 RepID=Q97AQ7_THEVO|nr:zinc-ribbon domain-containing protein [Thermoplasma volcanium]BAB59894.1 TVG0758278 [Thermoplasma volcanium GSS1]